MKITKFKDMYIAELQELASLEMQLADALHKVAAKASHPALKDALLNHREETLVHAERLADILKNHGAELRAHTDQAMQALIKETDKMMKMLNEKNLRDAGLIASAQKIEHYEIAAYGTAAALAGQLELRDDQRTLFETLEEEKKADALLSELAKGGVNQDALAA